MSARLGRAAQALRLEHGFTLLDVATRARVSESVVHQFERGTGWRRRTDEIVAAYAKEAGVEPVDIWRAAIDAWSSG